jgi:hypothetical protein
MMRAFMVAKQQRLFAIVSAAVALALTALPELPSSAVPIAVDGYDVSLFATGIGSSAGMRYGPDGALYVTDYSGGRVLRVDGSGVVSAVAAGAPYLTDVAFTASGRGFVASSTGSSSTIYEVTAGGLLPFATGFSFPTSMAAFGDDIFVANSGSGTITRLALDGGRSDLPLALAAPDGPYGLSFDHSGTLYFIEHGSGRVMSYDFVGTPTQIASGSAFGGTFTGIGFDSDLFFTDVNLGQLWRVVDIGVTELVASGFAAKSTAPAIGPQGIAYDGAASLFVADAGSIWRVTRTVAVPEPGTLALLCAGLAVVVVRSRFRRAVPKAVFAVPNGSRRA